MKRGWKAVFFDAGHTLLRAQPSVGAIYAGETRALGADIPPGRFEEEFREVFREFMPTYLADPGNRTASDEQDATMWREVTRRVHDRMPELRSVDYERWFLRLYHKFSEPDVWEFYPDARETLRTLRARGLKLGVVSNWDTRLRRIANETGLADLVDFVIISAEVGVRKPEPGIFDRALKLGGVEAGDALHVGDLFEEDVLGAHRAGLQPVFLDRGGRGVPSSEFPVWVIHNLAELTARLG